MSPDLQAHIGLRLKAFYDSVLSEPIPDRFAQLLDRLDAAEATTQPAANGSGASGAGEMRADGEEIAPSVGVLGSDVRS